MKSSNLLTQLDACPPFLCYYGAHITAPERPTMAEMVSTSGMSARTFIRISQRITWGGVTVKDMAAFAAACGVNLLDAGPVFVAVKQQLQSGELVKRFRCGGRPGNEEKMVGHFNVLASKWVLARESAS